MTGETALEVRGEVSSARRLVFTSAGDYSCLALWSKRPRSFDLWVSHYGNTPGNYRQYADYYMERKGAKFPNLAYAASRWPAYFSKYDAVLVIDDDLNLSAAQIDALFDLREQQDLLIVQPAYTPRGKNSHDINVAVPFMKYRLTNFVEMGAPLFRKDVLDNFLKVFDGSLTGIGTDWWFLQATKDTYGSLDGRLAIVDAVVCTNPFNNRKGGRREIERLQSIEDRSADWRKIKQQFGITIDEAEMKVFDAIPADRKPGAIVLGCNMLLERIYFKYWRQFKPWLKKLLGRPE